jgi:hypothetical protein
MLGIAKWDHFSSINYFTFASASDRRLAKCASTSACGIRGVGSSSASWIFARNDASCSAAIFLRRVYFQKELMVSQDNDFVPVSNSPSQSLKSTTALMLLENMVKSPAWIKTSPSGTSTSR